MAPNTTRGTRARTIAPGAHRARLERHVEHAVEHPPAAERPGGLAQRDDLGVGGGVLAQLALVVPGGDHLAVVDDHRADRDVVVVQRALGLAQGQAHEVVVAGNEARATVEVCEMMSVPFKWGNFGLPMMS